MASTKKESLAPFQSLLEDLLTATGATRTTLRRESQGAVFPVVAEALAPGARSISRDDSIDIRAAPTFRFLEEKDEILVQEDCVAGEHAPPPELLELYGVRAQMLAPIKRDGALIAIISVHYAPGPRPWTDDDVAALRRTREAVAQLLDKR